MVEIKKWEGPKKGKVKGWAIGLNWNVVEETTPEGNGNEVEMFKAINNANHNYMEKILMCFDGDPFSSKYHPCSSIMINYFSFHLSLNLFSYV